MTIGQGMFSKEEMTRSVASDQVLPESWLGSVVGHMTASNYPARLCGPIGSLGTSLHPCAI